MKKRPKSIPCKPPCVGTCYPVPLKHCTSMRSPKGRTVVIPAYRCERCGEDMVDDRDVRDIERKTGVKVRANASN